MISSEVFIDQTQEGRNFRNYYNYNFNSIVLWLFLKQKKKIFIFDLFLVFGLTERSFLNIWFFIGAALYAQGRTKFFD
jgi:hypothetical protein